MFFGFLKSVLHKRHQWQNPKQPNFEAQWGKNTKNLRAQELQLRLNLDHCGKTPYATRYQTKNRSKNENRRKLMSKLSFTEDKIVTFSKALNNRTQKQNFQRSDKSQNSKTSASNVASYHLGARCSVDGTCHLWKLTETWKDTFTNSLRSWTMWVREKKQGENL